MDNVTPILFSGQDYNVILHLEGSVSIPGSAVNAETIKTVASKVAELDRLADIVDIALNVAASSGINAKIDPLKAQSQVLSLIEAQPTDQFTAPVAQASPISVFSALTNNIAPRRSLVMSTEQLNASRNFNVLPSTNKIIPFTLVDGERPVILTGQTPTNPKLVTTYEQVIEHFRPGPNKVFVTGYTDSKFAVIDKYFPKAKVLKTYNLQPRIDKVDVVASQSKIDLSSISVPVLTTGREFSLNIEPNGLGGFTGNISALPLVPTLKQLPPQVFVEPVINITDKVTVFVGDENNTPIRQEPKVEHNITIRTKQRFTIPGINITSMILVDSNDGHGEYVLYLDTENPIKYVDLGTGLSIFSYLRTNDQPEVTTNIVLHDGIVEEPKIISEVFIDRGLTSAFENVKKLKNIATLNELTKTGLGFYKINTKGYNFKNL